MVTKEVVEEKVLLQVKLPRILVARLAALCVERDENRAEVTELLLTLGLDKLESQEKE